MARFAGDRQLPVALEIFKGRNQTRTSYKMGKLRTWILKKVPDEPINVPIVYMSPGVDWNVISELPRLPSGPLVLYDCL